MQDNVLITEISRFSVNDGPGFRTDVFLKGCPLRCAWCHNPETISSRAEIFWKRRLCVQCGACLDACPRGAISPPVPPEISRQEEFPYRKIIRERCDLCMKCVEACRFDALQVTGRAMSAEEILDEVERDRPFYDNSGGGMTLSGGEPTAHPEFSAALLSGARVRGLHTCIDTNGHCDFEVLMELSSLSDIVLYDLKHLDPIRHQEKTGVRNERILDNLTRLSRIHPEIWIRIPVVPDHNDDFAFHRKAADFIASLGEAVGRIDLLPYHNWCQDKYGWLGIDWVYRDVEALDPSFLEIHAGIYREKGLRVTIGGSGFEEADTTHGPEGCSAGPVQ